MRILALDLGDQRIGLALSDPTGTIAQELGVIARRPERDALAEIRRRAQEVKVERIVVGLPLRMDGTEGAEAEKAHRFISRLQRVIDIPVDVQDERLTTVEAERLLISDDASRARRRQRRDAVAAALILRTYLDRHR